MKITRFLFRAGLIGGVVFLVACGSTLEPETTEKPPKTVPEKTEEPVSLPDETLVLPELPKPKPIVENTSGIQFSAPDVSQTLPSERDSQAAIIDPVSDEEGNTILARPESPVIPSE